MKAALNSIKKSITKSKGYTEFISYDSKVTFACEFYISVMVTIVTPSTCEIGNEVTEIIAAEYDLETKKAIIRW